MIRDRGPISSLGFGVTSRDIPIREGETEGPSPNSGILSKALNGHPVMRFFAASTATMAGSVVASKIIKSGGIKLAKFIQSTADSGGKFAGSATRFVESAGKIKKALDELEGVTRQIDGVDPSDVYSKLIFQIDGRTAKQNLTRLQGGLFQLEGNQFLTSGEIRQASAGVTREPAAVWSFKDDMQQALVKRARNLAFELPAMYVTQRAVVDPFFGTEQDRRRVKWYNPVDVIADFSKQSAINMATMLTPFDLGGAAISRIKFLAAAPTAKNPNLRLTARQTKFSNAILDVKTILSAFGQDVEKVVGSLTRNTTAMTAAFATAVKEGGAAEGNVVFAMRQARRGSREAGAAAGAGGQAGKLRKAAASVKAYLFGYEIQNVGHIDHGTRLQGFADAVPSLKGITLGVAEFRTRFKAARTAYDVVNGAISYDQGLAAVSGIRSANPQELLASSIKQVRSLHSSIFSDYSNSILRFMGPSAIAGQGLSQGKFAKEIETEEYKKALYRHLVSNGVNEGTADVFIKKVGLVSIPRSYGSAENISQRMQFGATKIIDKNNTQDFFKQVISRDNELEKIADATFTPEAFESAVILTDVLFANKQFQQNLKAKINRAWSAFYDDVAIPTGRKMVRAQKALYKDFEGDISQDKADYLARSAADELGINLLDENGQRVSRAVIGDSLARRGIDISNIGQLRAFLMQQKRMTSSTSKEGYNLFGLKPLLIDEAFDMGMFGYLDDNQTNVIEGLASEIARTDPISSSIGYSELKGVYRTQSGNIIDTTRLRSAAFGAMNFVRDQLQIPIIKFNPLDMIGYGGPQGIDHRNIFSMVPSLSFQPFGQIASEGASALVFAQERRRFFGPTGSIYSISGTSDSLAKKVSKLTGTFRQFATNENDMFSRTARIVAGRQINQNLPQAGQQEQSGLSILEKIQRRFDVAEEQPNSLLRYFGRFRQRRQDLYNPVVFGKLLRNEVVETKRGSTLSLTSEADNLLKVVDESGDQVYGHQEVLRAYESFRRRIQSYGTPVPVIRGAEQKYSSENFLRNILSGSDEGINLSQVRSQAEMREFAVKEIEKAQATSAAVSSQSVDTRSLTASMGVVRSKLEEFDLDEMSPRVATSPTITTKVDELREAIFQLALQRRAFAAAQNTGNVDIGQFVIDIEQIILELLSRDIISKNQATEARAAGLSSVLNFVAFRGYKKSATESENLTQALKSLMSIRDSGSQSFATLLDPFISQNIVNVGTGGIGNDVISIFRPFVSRTFKPSEYRLKETAVNELGNQGTVFVPTFGTVVSSVGFGRAAKSALGFSTYSDAEAFSAASVPVSHGVQRLNKYFETFGLGLDESKYSGPMSLYAGGMVAKRAVPLVLGGTALLTADRTIGGLANERDRRGERV